MNLNNVKNSEGASIIRFSKVILGWNVLRLQQDNLLEQKNKKRTRKKLKEVKNTYSDLDDYLATLEPLLFEEVKAHIVKKKDDDEDGVSAAEWKNGLIVECKEADGFHFPVVYYKEGEVPPVSQNDLLLLSKEEFKEGDKPPTTYAFALVENRQKDRLRLRMYLGGEFMQVYPDVEEKNSPRLAGMKVLSTSINSCLLSIKICSLSTIAREYIALRSIGSLPFKDLILTPSEENSGSKNQAWTISKSLEDYFDDHLNKSQKEAVYAGLSHKEFVLIQGPPGTGKTETVRGVLSALLHRTIIKSKVHEVVHRPQLTIAEKYDHWYKASPWLFGTNPRDVIMPIDGDDGFFPTTGNELKPEVVLSRRKYPVRVLVCSPSNSALDEIVFRLIKSGLRDENGSTYTPKIVRIGLKPHHSVETVSLDYLVNQKRHLAGDKEKGGATGGDLDSIRATILDEAVIVFSTLSFSGSAVLTKLSSGFDVVIIDEAAQAVEPAALVPLASGCKQVFLIGDPKQLPPTVLSNTARELGYGASLFERFQNAGYPVYKLSTQYRMHPKISTVPSKEFYDGGLEDGPDVELQTMRDWHKFRCFGPFCFFDIHQGKESRRSGSDSLVNEDEIEFALLMYHKLLTKYQQLKSSSQVAIITPYKQQAKLFQERFQELLGVESKKMVEIGTVDGFQGREKDVVIISCVRAKEKGGIGFVSDIRRMNVATTRAKSTVLLVGSASALKKNDEHWEHIIEYCKQRNCYFKVSKPFSSFFSNENLEAMMVKDENAAMADGMDACDDENIAVDVNPAAADDFGDGDVDMVEGDDD